MDIRQLKHFASVAQHRNFSRAAAASNISQPALTRSVKLLEEELGTELFRRVAKGVEITNDGEILLRHALLIINSVGLAREEIVSARSCFDKRSVIGIANLFNEIVVHKAVTAACKDDPEFRFSVQVGLYEDLALKLREGFLDLIVSTNADLEDSNDLEFEPVGEIRSVVVVGCENPLAQIEIKSLDQLADVPWVTLDHPHTDAFRSAIFARAGAAIPNSTVRTTSLGMLRSLVREQHFVGWLPLQWAQDEADSRTLKIIDLPETSVSRIYGIVTRRGLRLNESARALVKHVKRAQ